MVVTTRKRAISQVDARTTALDKEPLTPDSSLDGAVKSASIAEATSSTSATEPSDGSGVTGKRRLTDKAVQKWQYDSDSDYETIKVRKGHPSLRDPSELPIVTKDHLGERKVLWAKMDTGADVNVMAEKAVSRLGLTHLIEPCETALREIGGNGVDINRKIVLDFWAGRKNALCERVEFHIPSQTQDTDHDGVPDVLLGFPELRKHHMIMVDPDFCNEPEDGLEVLAKRARDEVIDGEVKGIYLGVKYPQVKVRK